MRFAGSSSSSSKGRLARSGTAGTAVSGQVSGGEAITLSKGDGCLFALLGAWVTVFSDVGVCVIREWSGTAEGQRVPSGGSFVRSLLNGVEAIVRLCLGTGGVFDDLSRRLLELGEGFAALILASSSAIRRLMMSAVLSPAMIDPDDVGMGVQGRGGSLGSCVLKE
jgi:hypothetical protein